MPESIVDKVMEDWVYSGRLQEMSAAQVEEGIHRRGKGNRRAEMSLSSVALPLPQGLEPVTIREVIVEDREWDRPPLTIRPRRQRRGKREFLDSGVLMGPGSPKEKAEKLGVSHMTVRRRMDELKKEGT